MQSLLLKVIKIPKESIKLQHNFALAIDCFFVNKYVNFYHWQH